MPHRSAEEAFKQATLLGWPHRRKRIPCVEGRIAEHDVGGTLIRLRPGLGDDVDPPAAGSLEFRSVGVLVDLDLLNRRGRNIEAVDLEPVDDERRTACADRRGIEKTRNGGQDVLVEDGQALECSLVETGHVEVRGRVRGDLCRPVAHGDILLQPGERQRHSQRSRCARSDRHPSRRRLEPIECGCDLAAPAGGLLEAKGAVPVREGRLDRAVATRHGDPRVWQDPASRIHDHTGNGHRGLSLGEHNEDEGDEHRRFTRLLRLDRDEPRRDNRTLRTAAAAAWSRRRGWRARGRRGSRTALGLE